MNNSELAEQSLARLQDHLRDLGPVAVAVSGGVDSMTLAYVAHEVNRASEQYHALSAAVPELATERVCSHAEQHGWNLFLIDAGEMNDPAYLSNPVDRCYYCKSCLYGTIQKETDLVVASGTNLDDLSDYRPGLKAASEHRVCHPYVDVGLDKEAVRAIARYLGLTDLSELPAAPCLSSRVTTGISIESKMLKVIDQVELKVWEMADGMDGLRGVRCRIREEEVAIELDASVELSSLGPLLDEIRQQTRTILHEHGMADRGDQITIEPYRMGSAFLIESVQIGN